MRFDERRIQLKDKRECILRPTMPDDAQDMIEYLKLTSAETEYLLRYPDEVNYTLEDEKEILARLLDDEYNVMMVAVVDGKVAGNCSINGIGNKRKIYHRCSMAVALYKDYWDLGIGSAMISYLCELAAAIGYKQIDLEVVAENKRAQALYKKCGFIESGKRHNALRFDDGSYHDEIIMYKEI